MQMSIHLLPRLLNRQEDDAALPEITSLTFARLGRHDPLRLYYTLPGLDLGCSSRADLCLSNSLIQIYRNNTKVLAKLREVILLPACVYDGEKEQST